MRLFVTQGIDRTRTSASPQSLLLLLFSCTLLINCIEPIDGMITIAGNGNEYQSIIESSFGSGSSLKYGVQYASRLQYFDAYDYGGDTEIDGDGNDNGGGGEVVRQLNVNLCDDVQEGNLIRANDSSVAILARQGRCGIEHKARIASKLNHDGTNKNPEGAGFVKFLIVYQYDQDDEYYKEQEQERERRRKEHENGDTPVSASSIHQNEEGDSYNDILEQDRVYLQRLLLKQQHHTEEGAGTSTADDRQHDVIPTTITATTTAATPQQSRSRHLSNMYKDWKQRLYNPSSHSQNSSSSISSSTSHKKKQQYQYLYDGDIDVVILYISKLSGLDLISNLHAQTSLTYKHGGTVIYIDSYQGWVPSSGTNPEMTVVDAIVIAAFVFICCLGIFGMCANQMLDVGPPGEGQQGGGGTNGGLFRRRGLVVLERGETDEHGNRWGPGRYRHGLRLLNEDEVLSLPEVEFSLERALGGGDSHDGNGDSKGQTEEKDEEGECEEGGDLSSPSSSSPLTTPLLSSTSTCNHFQDISCTICLEDYCEGEKLRILPCQHAFHQDCIVPWLTDRAPTCPLCKAHLLVSRDGDDYDSDEEDHDEESSQYDSSSEAAVGDIEEDENEASRTIENEFAAWFYSIFTRVRGRSSDDSNETMSATEVEVADIVEDDPLNDMREPLLQDGGDQIHDHSAEDNV